MSVFLGIVNAAPWSQVGVHGRESYPGAIPPGYAISAH